MMLHLIFLKPAPCSVQMQEVLGAGEAKKINQTSPIHPSHQGGGEATLLQEDQEEPPAGRLIVGDEGG